MSELYRVTVEDCSPEDCGDCDRRHRLTITHRGKVLAEYLDYGEPEDNSFRRDWLWVNGELTKAYKLGFEDGRGATHEDEC